jgi:hypothetical protein
MKAAQAGCKRLAVCATARATGNLPSPSTANAAACKGYLEFDAVVLLVSSDACVLGGLLHLLCTLWCEAPKG